MGRKLILATDGSCAGNQFAEIRRSAYGFVVVHDGHRLHEGSGSLESGPGATNMTAEYDAILQALRWTRNNFDPETVDITVYSDNETVVNQIEGEYRTNYDHLRDRRDEVREELARYASYELTQVSDTENELLRTADRLAKAA